MKEKLARELLEWIRKSPSCYHVIANFEEMLQNAGYTPLREEEKWSIAPGGRYYVTRNGSSIIAFRTPETLNGGFMMAAAHSDSPTFKLKVHAEKSAAGHYIQLSTEKYGGMLMSTWLDRPLSVAGRVLVQQGENIEVRLADIDHDLLVIPNVAIHMERSANDGKKYQAHIDTLPLLGNAEAKDSLLPLLAKAVGAQPEEILSHDLFLYCRQPGTLLGAEQASYILSPKLDDLECAYGCMKGFLQAEASESIPVCCVFDNEEVGSSTKQGAASAFLRDTLRRIVRCLGMEEEAYQMLLARSFLVSADNAHAQHPNHPELADGGNCPYMNEGVVIKYNANQHYTTDGVSDAIFRSVCKEADVPVQVFANRSDMAGGGTLGSIANTMVPVNTVDIGLPQLAMHSAVETAGVDDLSSLVQAMTCYYGKTLCREQSGVYRLK